MALTKLICKAGTSVFRPLLHVNKASFTSSSAVRSSDKYNDLEDFEEYGLPDDLDVSCGMYRKELIARLAGVQDPFSIAAVERGDKGTKIDPIRVPSALPSRLVACKCDPESHTLLYMWLHQNEPKRCRCGFWVVLFYREPFVEFMMPY